MDQPLADQLRDLNARARARGVRGSLEDFRGAWVIRGTFGGRRQRIPLELPARPETLLAAEGRLLQFHEMRIAGRWPGEPLPWAVPAPAAPEPGRPFTCAQAIELLEQDFWAGRRRTATAQRTWDRLAVELRRLPLRADLTLPLLAATISSSTAPGSRSRLEAVKVYRRLGRVAGLEGLDRLQKLAGTYVPRERQLPTDEALEAFLHAIRPTRWGWCWAALAAYGCRPAEVPSLELHDDGTAQVLSLKLKNRAPAPRTCFALPRRWVAELRLEEIEIPGEARWTRPADYDSEVARRWVQRWNKSMRAREASAALELLEVERPQLYDLRHAWAVRSIRSGLPLTICAKALGHSAAVHERTYHRWISEGALREAMARLG